MIRRVQRGLIIWLLASLPLLGHAASVRVAVASNFSKVAGELTAPFKAATGHDLKLSFGSSGKFVAQITHGAPFEVFLSADTDKPKRLLEKGLAIGKPKIYAVGRLVLWSPKTEPVISGSAILEQPAFRHLAIANATLAPYGAAAQAALERLQLTTTLKDRIVEGENISQTYQYVASGAAELGFVALSQVMHKDKLTSGSGWIVPADMHPPIEQAAVLLKRGADNPAAQAFMDYLSSDTATALLQSYGYQAADR